MATQHSGANARKTEAQQSFHEEADLLRNRADELKQRSGEMLRDTIDEFKERGDDVRAIVKAYVHEKPFKSLGFAVLAGMALALILKR